jgi:hypothetical protein
MQSLEREEAIARKNLWHQGEAQERKLENE